MLMMVGGGMMVALLACFLLLSPQDSQAATPLRAVIQVRNGTTRQIAGYTQHHLLVEALASASMSTDHPFSYQITDARMHPLMMFGARDDASGYWRIMLNGAPIDNLHNVTIQRGDSIIVEHHSLP